MCRKYFIFDELSENVENYFLYTYDEIYFDTEGNIYAHNHYEGYSDVSGATKDEINFNQVYNSEYLVPVSIIEFETAIPDIRHVETVFEEDDLVIIADLSPKEYHATLGMLDGTLSFEAYGTTYDEPFKNSCPINEDTSLFSKYPIKSSTEIYYNENGKIESSLDSQYTFNDDCSISNDSKLTSSTYTEYYPNGVIAYELIETYENGEVVTSSEVYYDENGNVIIPEEPVDPIDTEEIPVIEEAIPIVQEEVKDITVPVTTIGVEQVKETKN